MGGAFSYKVTKWGTSVSIFSGNVIRRGIAVSIFPDNVTRWKAVGVASVDNIIR